jgi:hypothetical protein
MFQGFEIIFRVAVAILCQNQVELLAQDMEGMLRVSSFCLSFK